MAAVERFDIEKVTQTFQECLRDEDDVNMDEYLKAYEEINKYISLTIPISVYIYTYMYKDDVSPLFPVHVSCYCCLSFVFVFQILQFNWLRIWFR